MTKALEQHILRCVQTHAYRILRNKSHRACQTKHATVRTLTAARQRVALSHLVARHSTLLQLLYAVPVAARRLLRIAQTPVAVAQGAAHCAQLDAQLLDRRRRRLCAARRVAARGGARQHRPQPLLAGSQAVPGGLKVAAGKRAQAQLQHERRRAALRGLCSVLVTSESPLNDSKK